MSPWVNSESIRAVFNQSAMTSMGPSQKTSNCNTFFFFVNSKAKHCNLCLTAEQDQWREYKLLSLLSHKIRIWTADIKCICVALQTLKSCSTTYLYSDQLILFCRESVSVCTYSSVAPDHHKYLYVHLFSQTDRCTISICSVNKGLWSSAKHSRT